MSPNPEIGSSQNKNAQSTAERTKQRQPDNRTPSSTPTSKPGERPSPVNISNSNGGSTASTDSKSGERCQLIAQRAYFLAEQRQFIGGDPVEDWLQAEREIGPKSDDMATLGSPS